jgi:hypothetical protein
MDTEIIMKIGGIVIAAVPVLWKAYKIWKDSRNWKKIGLMGLDFIEHQLANEKENNAHAKAKQLQNAQDLDKTQVLVDKELDDLRAERLRKAAAGELSIGADIDEKGKWKIGANWSKTF